MPRTISSGQPAAGGAASNVEIVDGGATGATVFDYTNSNPVATQLVDSNGDPVSVGGGTQYSQGTATTDTDVLTMAGAVRRDTAAVATGVADGDRLVLSTDSAGRLRATSADVTQPVSAAALPLPTGAATSAKQDSEIALLTTIDADTSTLAGAVSGTEMQVDVLTLPALPAGNNNIGDVDVASVTGNVTVVQGTSTNLKADITIAAAQTLATVTTVGAVTAITNALPAGTNFIGNVGNGKSLKTKTGSASATFTLISAHASNRLKVYSISLITASTTAVTVTFKDGAGGTAIATYPLQAITGTNFGITENVAVPSFLFATTANTLLEMAFSAAQTVTYNVRYWDDDLT